MKTLYQSVQDYVISVCTIALAGLMLWGARDIPPPFFDPLGSAAVPKACAYVLIVLALGISLRRFFENHAPVVDEDEEAYRHEPLLALAVVGLSVLYTLAMGAGWIGFKWGTVLYIFATGSALAKGNIKVMAISLVIGLTFGIGGYWLFTNLYYIDLPQ